MFDITARATAPMVAFTPASTGFDVSAAAMAAALDEIGQGVLILDVPSGRLRHANRLALTECACHGLLSLDDGLLRASAPVDHRLLQQALQSSMQGRRGLVSLRGSGPTRAEELGDVAATATEGDEGTGTPGTPGHRPMRPVALVVAVVPLPTHLGLSQAMVVFGRRQMADTLAVGYFARLHGLTPAEESVLLGLCRGHKPTDIATTNGVAISTIRTHVNALRFKTGASSIREITQQVAMLPPLAPALRDGLANSAGSR